MARSKPSSAPPRYVHRLQMHGGAPQPSVDVQEIDLRDRIAELEEMVAAAPYLARKHRESARHLVPPDEDFAERTLSATERRFTKLEKRAQSRERHRHIVVSLALVIMLIGLLNWLAHLLRI